MGKQVLKSSQSMLFDFILSQLPAQSVVLLDLMVMHVFHDFQFLEQA
jgi:hypothetical protein